MTTTAPMTTQQALAAAIARRLYGFRPTAVVRLGGLGSHVFWVDFGGLPAKVIKLPGSARGIGREQRLLRALRRQGRGMPVPAIEFTEGDLPPAWSGGGGAWSRPATVSVMRAEPGMPLADAILRGESWAGDAIHAAGALAARLSEFPAALLGRTRPYGPEALRREIEDVRPVAEALSLWPRLERLVVALAVGPSCLAHGRLTVSRFLATHGPGGVKLCLTGFTRARAAPPLRDLGTLIASLADLPQGDAGQIAFLRRRAIDGFAALRPISCGDEACLAAWETLQVLAIAQRHMAAGHLDRAASIAGRAGLT